MELPANACVLRLGRIDSKDRLILCEAMEFGEGVAGVNTVLRRAAISGRVEIGGDIKNHLADVLNDEGDLIETVALDGRSYSALKNRWMRCKVEQSA